MLLCLLYFIYGAAPSECPCLKLKKKRENDKINNFKGGGLNVGAASCPEAAQMGRAQKGEKFNAVAVTFCKNLP